MGHFASRPGASPTAVPSGKGEVDRAQQRLRMPRETEEQLTARVSAELKRSLRVLATAALIGLGLGYLLK